MAARAAARSSIPARDADAIRRVRDAHHREPDQRDRQAARAPEQRHEQAVRAGGTEHVEQRVVARVAMPSPSGTTADTQLISTPTESTPTSIVA